MPAVRGPGVSSRPMTTPTRARGARTPDATSAPPKAESKPASKPSKAAAKASSNGTRPGARRAPRDPDGGDGVLHSLLTAAVDEAARLLHADGAMVYLIDHESGNLRFAHDAGIKHARTRKWIRTLELAPGVGMFGQATADSERGGHLRLPQRRVVPSLAGRRPRRRRPRHHLDGRGPAGRRRRGLRRSRHVLGSPGRVRCRADRAGPLARRARRERHGQCAAHRGARPIPPGA